jgi:hypothetical protein
MYYLSLEDLWVVFFKSSLVLILNTSISVREDTQDSVKTLNLITKEYWLVILRAFTYLAIREITLCLSLSFSTIFNSLRPNQRCKALITVLCLQDPHPHPLEQVILVQVNLSKLIERKFYSLTFYRTMILL